MKKLYRDRLLKLAAFLDTVPRKHFNMDIIAEGNAKDFCKIVKGTQQKDCGTAGCACGWLPVVFPQHIEFVGNGDLVYDIKIKNTSIEYYDYVAETFFDIDEDDVYYLFNPESYPNGNIDNNVTPKTVAKRIRSFVAKKLEAQLKDK